MARIEKGKSWAEQGFTQKTYSDYTQSYGVIGARKNSKQDGIITVKMKKVTGINPKTNESVSAVYPVNEQERFNMNRGLARANSYTFNSEGKPYVVSEKNRHRAQGEIARGKRQNVYYNYNKNKK